MKAIISGAKGVAFAFDSLTADGYIAMPQACLLAIIAGYADAIGFLKYDTFAGLMTGNTILLGIAISNAKLAAALFQFAIIAVFTAGVILARIFLRLHGKPPLWLLA